MPSNAERFPASSELMLPDAECFPTSSELMPLATERFSGEAERVLPSAKPVLADAECFPTATARSLQAEDIKTVVFLFGLVAVERLKYLSDFFNGCIRTFRNVG